MPHTKLAAYTDEAGDDVFEALETLASHSISIVALRNLWSGNVLAAPDAICKKVRTGLQQRDQSVLLLATELGCVPAEQLLQTTGELDRAFVLCNYFEATYIRIGLGTKVAHKNQPETAGIIQAWMTVVSDLANKHNVIPVCELTHDSACYEAATIAAALHSSKRWKLLFDPAQLIVRRNVDPFVRYWSLFRSKVVAVDVHDCKIGAGYCPAGQGDANLAKILADYDGWRILEPGLGRRFGGEVGRTKTFDLALQAYQTLIDGAKTQADKAPAPSQATINQFTYKPSA